MATGQSQSTVDRITAIVALEAGGERSALTSDEAITVVRRISEKLSRQISTVIGSDGFQALFDRSVEAMLYPSPSPGRTSPTSGRSEFEDLLAQLSGRPSEFILQAGTDLFSAFCIHLATFIGEALVARLLRSAWPDSAEGSRPAAGKNL